MGKLYSKWFRVFPKGQVFLMTLSVNSFTGLNLNFYLPPGQHVSVFQSTSQAFHRSRIENVRKGWSLIECQKNVCRRVLDRAITSALCCWSACSLTGIWMYQAINYTTALQKEIYSTLYVIEFVTVTYTHLNYLTLLCCSATMNSSQSKGLDLGHKTAAVSLGVKTDISLCFMQR